MYTKIFKKENELNSFLLSFLGFVIIGLIPFLFADKLSVINEDSVFSFVLVFMNMIVLLFNIVLLKTKDDIKMMLIAALFFRFVLFVWDIFLGDVLAFPIHVSDAGSYSSDAASFYLSGQMSVDLGGFYSKFIGLCVYNLYGIQPAIVRFLNIMFSITSIHLVVKTLKNLNVANRVIKIVAFLMAFLPFYAIYSVSFCRESVIIFLCAVSLYYFIGFYKNNKFSKIACAFIAALLSCMLHSGTLFLIIGYVFFLMFYKRNTEKFQISVKSAFIFGGFFCVFIWLYNHFSGELFYKFGNASNVQDVLNKSESVAIGGSKYNAGFNISNPVLNFIVNTPIKMIYFLFSPMPWDWRGLNDIVSFLCSSLVYGYLIFAAVKSLKNKNNKNRNIVIFCLVLIFFATVIFGWGVSNAGTAIRHRDKLICIVMVMFACSQDANKCGDIKLNRYR